MPFVRQSLCLWRVGGVIDPRRGLIDPRGIYWSWGGGTNGGAALWPHTTWGELHPQLLRPTPWPPPPPGCLSTPGQPDGPRCPPVSPILLRSHRVPAPSRLRLLCSHRSLPTFSHAASDWPPHGHSGRPLVRAGAHHREAPPLLSSGLQRVPVPVPHPPVSAEPSLSPEPRECRGRSVRSRRARPGRAMAHSWVGTSPPARGPTGTAGPAHF